MLKPNFNNKIWNLLAVIVASIGLLVAFLRIREARINKDDFLVFRQILFSFLWVYFIVSNFVSFRKKASKKKE